MPPKKKPLEDARKRLKEKLNNVEEQSEYICQFINDLVNKSSDPAKKLLEEKDRKKFFQKYSSVSQELEKCLDCLLLISDSVTALGEEDTLGGSEDYSSSAPSEPSEPAEQAVKDSALSEKTDRHKKDLPPSADETSKGSQNVPQVTEDSQRISSEAQKSIEAGQAKSQSSFSQSACAAKSTRNDEEASILIPASESSVVSKPPNVQQMPQSQAKQSIPEDLNKQSQKLSSKSGEGLNLISKLIEAEPAKQVNHQKQSEETSLAQPPKDEKRKGSPDVVQKQADDTSSTRQQKDFKGKGSSSVVQDVRIEPTKQFINQKEANNTSSARPPKEVKRRGSSSSVSALSDIIQDIRISPREARTAAENIPTKVQLAQFPFKNGQRLEVVVTEVLSPWEFWVQPVGSDELDLLMEEMCMHYAKMAAAGYKGGLATAPAVGDFCCAKFTQDDTWYRVLVTAVEESDKGPTVEVLCVDDGNREKVGLARLRPLEEKFLKLPCQALCCALSGVRPVNPPQNKPGTRSSLWSEESIAWLRCKVSGAKLRAYPTRVESSKLVIIDLFVFPPKNPKHKSPVSSQAGNGLPGLQFSIAEMMIFAGMAQRIMPQVNGGAGGSSTCSSSPVSVGSNESLPRSCSSVSIESSVQEGPACVNNCEAVSSKEESACTDNSCSSKETVIQKLEERHEKITASVEQSVSGRKNSNDATFKGESVTVQETDSASGVNLEKENCENAQDQQEGIANDITMLQESLPMSGPEESFITELPPMEGPLCLQMLMSHVVNPSEFYVHLVTPDAGHLDLMMNDLNKFYDGDPFPESCAPSTGYQPQVGDYCCARFTEDGRWYRSLVTSLRCTVDEKEGPLNGLLDVEVFHVDFGSSEWVSVGNVKPLVAKFLSLPGQVVKCRLANLKPEIIEDITTTSEQVASLQSTTEKTDAQAEERSPQEEKLVPVVEPPSKTDSSPTGKSRKKDRRKRKRPPKISLKDENIVIRAAGDESCDSSELSEIEFVKSREGDRRKNKQKEQDTSASDKAAFPEKYLLPSPDVSPEKRFPLLTETASVKPEDQWPSGSSELLTGLTDDNRKLVGYMVPWDPWIYQQLFNPTAGGATVDISYKKPVLNLNLYDTTGDEDIFINQVLVDTGIAVFVENPEEQTGLPSEEIDCNEVTSPTCLLSSWDPMEEDFLSSKNTYAVNTDDLDIVFQGYQDLSRRVCRYYQTRSGCWRGDQCPNLHVKKGEELHDYHEVFCDNMDSSVTLPDIGTWVAVRVTAIFDPGHFWVQFPYGPEPIENRIMAARMGRDFDSDDVNEKDDLDSLMTKMGKFYTKNVCQDPRRILPAPGELCVAKYSKDGQWYRARITGVHEDELQVFFVDYGNSEWTRESHVKRMLPHFLHLPFQALECFLGNVEPVNEAGENGKKLDWSEEAMTIFKSLTEDKILIAHILSKAWNQTIYVDLFDTNGEEIHINKVMIEKGFAKETDHTVDNPWNIEATVKFNPHKLVGLPG
ncbi:hypothetical protein ACROYT_G032828 [Oculina patagonica]